MITIQSIMKCALFKEVKRRILNSNEIEMIKRPKSYIIKKKEESERIIKRIIILPPHGFTGNHKNETNPHPEVRKAKIEIKGGIIPERQRFSRLDKIIKFQYFTNREIKQYKLYPYKKANLKDEKYKTELKSTNEVFYVVEENGKGFYHSLVNLSNYWILLILEKELLSSKKINLNNKISKLDGSSRLLIKNIFDKVKSMGDNIFEKEPKLVNCLISMKPKIVLPALIEMLNLSETGKHEPCTVFAIILKIARKEKDSSKILKSALKHKEAPDYYLQELISKIGKYD